MMLSDLLTVIRNFDMVNWLNLLYHDMMIFQLFCQAVTSIFDRKIYKKSNPIFNAPRPSKHSWLGVKCFIPVANSMTQEPRYLQVHYNAHL